MILVSEKLIPNKSMRNFLSYLIIERGGSINYKENNLDKESSNLADVTFDD